MNQHVNEKSLSVISVISVVKKSQPYTLQAHDVKIDCYDLPAFLQCPILPRTSMKKRFFLLLLSLAATSCYRMPTDDDYCLVPTTNNPDVIREKPTNSFQNMAY